jgi:hypothetical protein
VAGRCVGVKGTRGEELAQGPLEYYCFEQRASAEPRSSPSRGTFHRLAGRIIGVTAASYSTQPWMRFNKIVVTK